MCYKTQNNLLRCGATSTAKHFLLMLSSKEQSATIITVFCCMIYYPFSRHFC